jgi:hypothetical protein
MSAAAAFVVGASTTQKNARANRMDVRPSKAALERSSAIPSQILPLTTLDLGKVSASRSTQCRATEPTTPGEAHSREDHCGIQISSAAGASTVAAGLPVTLPEGLWALKAARSGDTAAGVEGGLSVRGVVRSGAPPLAADVLRGVCCGACRMV